MQDQRRLIQCMHARWTHCSWCTAGASLVLASMLVVTPLDSLLSLVCLYVAAGVVANAGALSGECLAPLWLLPASRPTTAVWLRRTCATCSAVAAKQGGQDSLREHPCMQTDVLHPQLNIVVGMIAGRPAGGSPRLPNPVMHASSVQRCRCCDQLGVFGWC